MFLPKEGPFLHGFFSRPGPPLTASAKTQSQAVAQLQASQKGISREDQKLKQQISVAPEKVSKILPAERQHKIVEALYIYLLEKREENNLTQVYNAQNLRIISPPLGKLKPVFPKKGTILILALLLGIALPAFFIYVKQNVKRIISEED